MALDAAEGGRRRAGRREARIGNANGERGHAIAGHEESQERERARFAATASRNERWWPGVEIANTALSIHCYVTDATERSGPFYRRPEAAAVGPSGWSLHGPKTECRQWQVMGIAFSASSATLVVAMGEMEPRPKLPFRGEDPPRHSQRGRVRSDPSGGKCTVHSPGRWLTWSGGIDLAVGLAVACTCGTGSCAPQAD